MRWMCLCLVLSGFAYGQRSDRIRLESQVFLKSEVIRDQMTNSRWKFGTFHITPILGLKELGYDNNVFSTEDSEINDISVSPEVGLQTWLRLSPFWVWSNKATYNYLYYVDLDNLRGGEYGAESRLHGLFKRSYFDIGADYRNDRQRLSSEIDERVSSERTTLDANLNLQASRRSHIILSARLSSLEYDSDELVQGDPLLAARFSSLERDETATSAAWVYKWKAHLWPKLEVSRRDFDFESIGNPRDDSSFTGVFVGARNEGDRRADFQVKLGIEQLDFQDIPALIEDPNNPGSTTVDPNQTVDLDEDVLSVEAFYSYKLTKRYYMESSILQTPIFSLSNAYTYFLSRKVSLEVGTQTRKRIRFGPEVILGENDYRKTFDTTLDELRNDDIKGLNLNVRFPVRNVLNWKLTAGWLKRDSNQPGLSDEGLVISSAITFNAERGR